jgi:hypothetical protein
MLQIRIKIQKRTRTVRYGRSYTERTDKEGLERFAREEYLMKKADEDVFIIKEK